MSAPSSKALVLDFGGVISRTLFETHDLSEAALGLPPGTLTWRGPFAPETDVLWQAMQADHITEREYWMARTRSVGELVGEAWTDMQTFVQRARGADVEAVIRPEAIAAVHQAKAAGCKLAVLSNELDLFYGASFRERLPLLKLFDVIIDATYTGILKPDRRAYEMCRDALGVSAQDCVFVDDQSRNVLGAIQVGWKTVQFDVTDPATSYARALALLEI
ncbi:HAD family hydrolase [Limnohabitans sp. MMS-10A-160]|jgi:putative hydrolase of the HAD superfamily|uniref:HAD-IA family hydrolase n=1 Tax=unclassified Limnohabitans TaxID=2626134 RepID=UPI000D350AB0|nr:MULTISPECIES: HAD-IA family hydrolase [unclassified Limnohabitans]PUE22279.1 HAD family hydrolase [Limnohabitans sp. MMS-10A-192]PUE25927.1 HAD family hydrolase [Limnohabitans sp. MMS-10A-160]